MPADPARDGAPAAPPRGAIAWMVSHRVAPNLLMLLLLVGGLIASTRITQEVFPSYETDSVSVSVSYPGATPAQIERGVILPVEEAVRGLEGVERVVSYASEGSGSVRLDLLAGTDRQKAYQDAQQAVARIDTFPDDAEEPRVALRARRRDVLDLLIYGDVPAATLRSAAETVLDRILQLPEVTQAELEQVRAHEIQVRVDEGRLREHGLQFRDVAEALARNARDRSAGSVRTASGELLLEVDARRERAREFEDIVVAGGAGGAFVRLADIATVREGFSERTEEISTFAGRPAIEIGVYRLGEQTPQGVSKAVLGALPAIMADLPPDIDFAVQNDSSVIYQQRLDLLLKNAAIGLGLVLLLLSLFLEPKLAVWVAVGIVTSFVGAFLFLPWMGVSINMISLFAFIIALGIVVDDAIIAGENIYEYRQRGLPFVEAAIRGAQDIAVPITFSVLTNIVAFLPLAFIPGTFGALWAVIPAVVCTIFAISLVEALLVLPGHLGHVRDSSTRAGRGLHAVQQRFSNAFSRFVERRYGALVALAIRYRYVTIGAAIGIVVIVFAWPMSGRMGFILMPRVESDTARVSAVLPYGAPLAEAERVRDRLVGAAERVIAENGGERLSRGVYASIEENEVDVRAYLTLPGVRPLSTTEMSRQWREVAGEIPGVEYVRFASDRGGPGGGAGVTIELSHGDVDILSRAAGRLTERLATLDAVTDVDDGYSPGKPQWTLRLTEAGRSLGLTADSVGRQVRDAFFGAEAFKFLRGGNEVTVRVGRPEDASAGTAAVSSLMILTPGGHYVPLDEVVTVEPGRALTSIARRDGRRTQTVTANVEPIEQTNRVLAAVRGELLPQLRAEFPSLTWSFEGRQAHMRDSLEALERSSLIALVVIYGLLAIPFRSYVQPAIIMVAIPFGGVGAIIGHMLMGYSLSVISLMGIIALAGVVVNDSLVMMDYANARRAEGAGAARAMVLAGVRRFRPIMLTTLTTFGGLAPMIFETSRQARFMIPMAISLGYGILFATAILLLLVPCLYVVLDDVQRLLGRGSQREDAPGVAPAHRVAHAGGQRVDAG